MVLCFVPVGCVVLVHLLDSLGEVVELEVVVEGDDDAHEPLRLDTQTRLSSTVYEHISCGISSDSRF
jgi:hypothetical protein